MNARLSSLLVAGGVVLAGIQSGSLNGAIPETASPKGAAILQGASLLPSSGANSALKLAIPGFSGVPRLQVLANPSRVVVDLPGVDRGDRLSKKDLLGLTSPLVLRSRLAQFLRTPEMVTRVVLEVAPGTRVDVSSDPTGVLISMNPGSGAVRAQATQAPAIASMETENVAAKAAVAEPLPVLATPPAIEAPVVALLAAVSAPMVEVAAPAAVVVATLAPVVVAPAPVVVAPAPVVATLAPIVATPAPVVVAPAPIVVAPAPVVATLAPVVATPAPIVVAPAPVVVAPAPVVATLAPVVVAPAPIVVAPVPVAVPAPRLAALTPVPAVGVPFQSLPTLAINALLPSAPVVQDKPAPAPRQEARRDDHRSGRTLGDPSARYTGTRMTIDVVNTDLISFLRIIADVAKLNLIADSDVQGIYTFKFVDAPWDQVLDVILKQAGLGKEISNGIIRVAKVEKLQKEEEDRKRLDDAKALSGEVQSITRPLSFAKAGEAKNIIDKILTKRGSMIIDERTNTLIISDLPRNLPVVDDLIATLDVQIQQVQIEARVVEASKNFDKAFGVKWPTSNSGDAKLTTNGSDATWGSFNGQSWNSINNRATDGNAAAVAYSPGQDGATSISGATGQFWVSFLTSRVSLNVILQAMEKEGTVKIISSPKIVTQNNKKAKILSGAKIPYPAQQAGNATGAITVAFADANLELEVTPQITNDGTILMDIHVEKADADFGHLVGATPTITRKMIETQMLVRDGGTAILGGVYKNTSSSSTAGVPFLSKLPIIGFLFRNKVDSDANDELLIFITPRILKN